MLKKILFGIALIRIGIVDTTCAVELAQAWNAAWDEISRKISRSTR